MKQILQVRDYHEADYDALKTMIYALAQEDIDPQETGIAMSEAKIQSTVLRSLTHPEQIQIKIFEIENSIAGYALLTFYWSNEYHGEVAIVDELFVSSNYRNQGIATEFINHLAQNNEYAALQLEVFKKNTKALKLYRRMNFEIVDRYFMIRAL